jgi:hypothetical protein
LGQLANPRAPRENGDHEIFLEPGLTLDEFLRFLATLSGVCGRPAPEHDDSVGPTGCLHPFECPRQGKCLSYSCNHAGKMIPLHRVIEDVKRDDNQRRSTGSHEPVAKRTGKDGPIKRV